MLKKAYTGPKMNKIQLFANQQTGEEGYNESEGVDYQGGQDCS